MIKLWHCLLVVAVAFVVHVLAQPPMPPLPQPAAMVDLGRQHPYMSTASLLVTQTVTTVSQYKFLRMIDLTTNSAETNFIAIRTNQLSCVTNTTDAHPK